ncbi:hypothetical protein RM844_21000 [Streptomyces sp. DSM 44915]|uniref:Secreted protein n=1 Tax=Streptomyces chisholmiae TaxID=3075540 RepID=A0ABU2JUW9_9ACTN|nr:hypothetical protein [Streptomyces sp. DSM 44915]MDT0268769.1 hypothetical protein [Streptomyces sp. DSM 44915]
MRRLTRRGPRWFALALLTAALGLTGAGQAHAADAEDPAAAEATEAGTAFRTATVIDQNQTATAAASTGDYLYWVFPAAAGQQVTAEATVTLPDPGIRSGPVTWRLDVYDGLRRYQSCTSGQQTATADETATTLALDCAPRPVRSWADPWSDTPLPGAYYLRLSVAELPERDLGLPVDVEVRVTAEGSSGSVAVGGSLAEPLLPVGAAGTVSTDAPADATSDGADDSADAEETSPYLAAVPEPDGGWMGGWWNDRWLWTTAGGVLAALAALGGYRLTRP